MYQKWTTMSRRLSIATSLYPWGGLRRGDAIYIVHTAYHHETEGVYQ